MKLRLLGLVLLLTLCVIGCRPGKDVYNPSNAFTIADNTVDATQKVRKAIIEACAEYHWITRDVSPGVIDAKIIVRGKHTAEIRITYSDTNYAINYVNSDNLEYKVKSDGRKVIHPNYNNWIHNLQTTINGKLNAQKI